MGTINYFTDSVHIEQSNITIANNLYKKLWPGDKFIDGKYTCTIIEYIENFKGYGPVYVLKRDDGVVYRLTPVMVEQKIKAAKNIVKNAKIKARKKYSTLYVGNADFWSFIRYLSQHGRIGGFQSTKDKEEHLKVAYYNETGEELREDQYNSDLSPNTWGNAMRVFFSKPTDMTEDEINNLLPDDVEAKKWHDNTNELIISRMPFVLELLGMGFRHGTKHNLEDIDNTIKHYLL